VERLGKGGNPFLAGVGLRVEPAPIDSGVEFRLEVDVGSMPLFVFKAVEHFGNALEETVRKTLQQGLCGWQVTDCRVTLTQSDYVSPGSTPKDFRLLTPLVLMSALQEAGTVVCEPIHRFHLEFPADTLAAILPALARLGAVPQGPTMRGSFATLEGDVPAARVHELQLELRGLTHGEGVLECALDHYERVSGGIPARPRSDRNPLNRKEYLLRVTRGRGRGDAHVRA
jgi:ribosomal protection tetracycline resistance protein